MRQAAAVTIAVMSSAVMALSVVLGSDRGDGWAFPAFLAVVAVVTLWFGWFAARSHASSAANE